MFRRLGGFKRIILSLRGPVLFTTSREASVLFREGLLQILAATAIGIVLGFFLSRQRNPLWRMAILALFLTFLSGLFGPAGSTLFVALIFAASFYYGWVITGNASIIEPMTKRVLFYLAALIFALIAVCAYSLLLGI